MKKIPKDIQAEVDKRLVEMLGFVDYKAVITENPKTGALFIGKDEVTESQLANLRSEAEFIAKSDLWKLLSETMRYYAYEKMFVKSTNFEDTMSGKMWLYHLDTQQKIMERIKNHKKPNTIPVPSPANFRK